MRKPRALKRQTLDVDAPAPLVFQVISSAGKRLASKDKNSFIAEFTTEVGSSTLTTEEFVKLDPPRSISYVWAKGPLPYVVEHIDLEPTGDQTCRITYVGEYSSGPGIVACLKGFLLVPRLFNRAVDEHLRKAKEISEKRSTRSKAFPQKD